MTAVQPSADAASCAMERETTLTRLRLLYIPPNYLRKKHKRKIKRIKSLEQGYDGKTALCCLCGKLGTVEEMDVHHFNHVISDNRLENLGPAHGNCNDNETAVWRAKQRLTYAAPRQSDHLCERESGAHASTDASAYAGTQWTSKEGKKHDHLRLKWNGGLWRLFHPENEEMNVMKKRDLAGFARSRNFVGEGASSTFYKMIAEDVACGIFKEDINIEGEEVVYFVWPNEKEREILRGLALAEKQGKMSHDELKRQIESIETTKEYVQLWSYVWYVQSRIAQTPQ